MANDAYEYITLTGTIVPDTSELLAQVQDEFRAAFGQDLVVDPETPQGVLIQAEVEARSRVLRNNALLANQINPNLAGGIYQDALLALTGAERNAEQFSSVTALLTGVPATVIPESSYAQTEDGDTFQLISEITLDVDGLGTGIFQAINPGPIAVPVGALNKVYSVIIGWETVTNAASATLGASTQSDIGARAFRRVTLGLQGNSTSEAITSALYNLDGVTSLTYRENVASTTVVIDDVSMVGHSIYVCVSGGLDQDIADTILHAKPPGANYNGTQTVDATDPVTGQTYTILFDRPNDIPVQARFTVKLGSVADPTSAVKQAVLAYAAGEIEGQDGFVVGSSVSPFELSAAVNALYPSIFITKVEVKKVSDGSFSTDTIPIAIFEKASIVASSITVITV